MTDAVKIALITATGAASPGMIWGWINFRKIRELHVIVNSRLTELLKVRGEASFAEGKAEGAKDSKGP